MSLYFNNTGIEPLDNFLYNIEQASDYVNDSTRWDEIGWGYTKDGCTTPLENIEKSLEELVVYLKKHQKLIERLKRQGFIQEEC